MPKARKTIADKKDALIASLVDARRSVLETAMSLPDHSQDKVFLGTWSLKDLLAHLAGWDYTNLQAVQEILAGTYPSFFRFYDQDWHSFNQRLVDQYRKETFPELLSEIEDSHRQLVSFLQELTPEEIVSGKAQNERGRTVTIRNLLISEASDERNHAQQIASFRNQ